MSRSRLTLKTYWIAIVMSSGGCLNPVPSEPASTVAAEDVADISSLPPIDVVYPDEPPVPADGTPWVIDMMPADRSGESQKDSEAYLAIHPLHSNILAATAFTEGSSNDPVLAAPIYTSVNGGQSWTLAPAFPGIRLTGDATVAFHPAGSGVDELRAAILRQPVSDDETWKLYELTGPGVPLASTMLELPERNQADQPFLTISNQGQWLVAHHDLENNPGVAVDHGYVDPLAAATTQWQIRYLDPNGGSLPACASVRIVVAPDGHAYAAFARFLEQTGMIGEPTAEIVVRRDNDLTDTHFFEDLPVVSIKKEKVVKQIDLPSFQAMGHQRIGPSLALAVDPTHSDRVWLAWADTVDSTLHVRRSLNGGTNWSDGDFKRITQATNAALSVAADGTVGLLYQQFVDSDAIERWDTHFERFTDSGGTNVILASFPANEPGTAVQPYLGDYTCLVARDDLFHGVFCSSNAGSFPSGVTWQRNHFPGTNDLLDSNGQPLQSPSIDPFYFRARTQAAGGPQ